MRYIDSSFIEYETQIAFDLQRQKVEALESLHHLKEFKDEHERQHNIHGVMHYDRAIKEIEGFIKS